VEEKVEFTKNQNKPLQSGKIISINISKKKGTVKEPIEKGELKEQFGLIGDIHAGGDELRQVSLLAIESIQEMQKCPKLDKEDFQLKPGDFAENFTTKGLDLTKIKIGNKFKIGDKIVLEVSKIGKECHSHCEIFKKIGSCIMPKEGIFARVLCGGMVLMEDKIEVYND
jgi:MOSC domain-containing protein YiiM